MTTDAEPQSALVTQLRDDLTTAIKARDEVTVRTLRMAIAAIKSAEVAGKTAVTLDDAAARKVLAKQATQRTDSAEAFTAGGRTERAVLERYLPTAMDDAALEAIVDEEIAAFTGDDKAAMGQIIKAVNARVQGQAEGKRVATLVKQKLA